MKLVHTPVINASYWLAILLASVSGTNLGDLYAHESGLGIGLGLLLLAALAAGVFLVERRDGAPRLVYYWLAIIIIRTGATNIADYTAFRLHIPQALLAAVLIAVMAIGAAMSRRGETVDVGARPATTNGFYWLAMLAAGIFGTVVGDVCSHFVGQGYASLGLLALLLVVLAAGRRHWTTVAVYWIAVAVARTAGTAVGDWLAENKLLNIGLLVSTIITTATFLLVAFGRERLRPRQAIALMARSAVTDRAGEVLAKVPAVTLGFWIIKILATTLGETGGDTVSMTWLGETSKDAGAGGINGYLVGTAMFGLLLAVLVTLQIRARRFNRWLYWATIVASTTAGTTLADFADRSLGIGYPGGSLLLLACVLGCLFAWRRTLGTVDVKSVAGPRAELFYWITITFSQTLGTALGDWAADGGLGYAGGALTFAAALAALAALYYWTLISRVVLFWAAFILTRPLGATVGDLFDKPLAKGGLDVSRPVASLILAIAIVVLILILPQRPGRHPGARPAA